MAGTPYHAAYSVENTSGQTSWTISVTTAMTAGDGLLAVLGMSVNPSIVSITDTKSNTYTLVASVTGAAASVTYAYAANAPVTALTTSDTIKVTFGSAAGTGAFFGIGVPGMPLLDGASSTDGSGTTVTVGYPTLQGTGDTGVAIACWQTAGGAGTLSGTGWAAVVNESATSVYVRCSAATNVTNVSPSYAITSTQYSIILIFMQDSFSGSPSTGITITPSATGSSIRHSSPSTGVTLGSSISGSVVPFSGSPSTGVTLGSSATGHSVRNGSPSTGTTLGHSVLGQSVRNGSPVTGVTLGSSVSGSMGGLSSYSGSPSTGITLGSSVTGSSVRHGSPSTGTTLGSSVTGSSARHGSPSTGTTLGHSVTGAKRSASADSTGTTLGSSVTGHSARNSAPSTGIILGSSITGLPGSSSTLIVSLASQPGIDDYGNPFPQGIYAGAGVIEGPTFVGLDFIINASGYFAYSGTPAFGNLAASVTPGNGTDAYGNAYIAGHTSYSPGSPCYAQQLDTGSLIWYTATTEAGPWTPGPFIETTLSVGSNLILSAGNGVYLGASANCVWADGIQQFQLPTGSGPFVASETWHDVSNGTGVTARVKMTPWNAVWLDVQATWTATTTINLASLPSTQYYPAQTRQFPIASTASVTQNARVFVPTSGALQIIISGNTGAGAGGCSVMYPTN
jgi:hypothetical protein